jgi:flagellar hook-basal body complex protein FliE
MNPIRPVGADILQRAYQEALPSKQVAPSETSGFGSRLRELVNGVDALQDQAGELQTAAIRGEDVQVHDVMIATEQAGLAFALMLEVRNKLVDAYQELMRMQA